MDDSLFDKSPQHLFIISPQLILSDHEINGEFLLVYNFQKSRAVTITWFLAVDYFEFVNNELLDRFIIFEYVDFGFNILRL